MIAGSASDGIRRRRARLAALVCWQLCGLAAAGCEGVLPAPDLERMISQRSYRAYELAPMFPDGRAMRPPPAGSISRDRVIGQSALTDGVANGGYVAHIPVDVDRPLLERGRDRFDIFCATCHGVRGDGVSAVAHNMEVRAPPSLLDAPAATFPPGRIFQVVLRGYGLMPSYASELPAHDAWAVVAYLQALRLSQAVSLDDLPSELRAMAQRSLQ